MQEEVNQRTVALTVKAAKLTGRVLAAAMQKYLAHLKKQRVEGLTPTGKQSVKQLMGHGSSTNSIPLDSGTHLFDRVARKYGVDYAFHKAEPGKYQLFFKAGQADAITAAFAEYTKLVLKRQRRKERPSILAQLKKLREAIRERTPQRERAREAAHEDR